MYIKRLINFFLEKENGKNDANVRLRAKWNNSKSVVAFGIGAKVDTDKWSYETQRCKINTTHGKKKTPASVINKKLQEAYDTAEKVFYNFEQKGINPTQEEFKREFNLCNGKANNEDDSEKSFFEIYDQYVVKQGVINSWSRSMRQKFHSLKNHIANFDKNVAFSVINENFMIDFIEYLQSGKSMKIRHKGSNTGMKNTSISMIIVCFKMFLRWAKKHGYYNGDVPENFNPKLKGVDGKNKTVIFLTWDELMLFYSFEFEHEYQTFARDVFCFCCFSSLRYSDAQNLKKNDIKDDCIHIVTQKTIDGLKIELNKYSKAILDKYKRTKTDKALPEISNIKMNEYLKEMAEIAGIDEPKRIVYFIGNQRHEEVYPKYELLTTHCGRRTFIVNALFLGIPAEVVMKWTGHRDYESMKPYIEIVDELKKESMKKFDLK